MENRIDMTDTAFSSFPKHTKEICDSLRHFSKIKAAQSIYFRQVAEAYYSVYVFLGDSRKQMNKLLELEAKVKKQYPNDMFQFSYLQDNDTIMIGSRFILIFSRKYT